MVKPAFGSAAQETAGSALSEKRVGKSMRWDIPIYAGPVKSASHSTGQAAGDPHRMPPGKKKTMQE